MALITGAGTSNSAGQQAYTVNVAMSSAGVDSEEPGQVNDFVAPYLKAFLRFLGMNDLIVFRAECSRVPGLKDHAMEKAIDSIKVD